MELRAVQHRQGLQQQAPQLQQAVPQQLNDSKSDEVPEHGAKRARWSPHIDASEMSPGDVEHSQEHAQEHSRGLKRQPESATEGLEDAGDQGDADDGDMEPVITIGVDGCENDEESFVDDVN